MAEHVPDNVKARLKSSYDAIADTYNANFTKPDDPVRLHYLNLLLSRLKANNDYSASVLELGCGAGVPATKHLLEVERPVIHVTGNDLSTSQLDLARKNLAEYDDHLTLVEGDMMALSFPEQTLDAVTGFYSIIHLPREEQTQLVRNIGSWLKPDGLLLANFAVDDSDGHVEEQWLGEDKGWMYWSAFGEEGSVKMLEDAGLEILVRETKQVEGDANFVWLLAKKTGA
ncbi:S-adenosyl-L-methionine-dependent methyltransferase [Macroventuria anomochaeta]|uniref:S-adenosyl-L-methionine-dependent methyltransferase n=1 Tax=Macroventuria anomochaeta TaxID=301207 RepID=A0ACB6S5S9_9PLEO|nr:S-adenosyl-L-methionine-dependent methyltransferase [Macroventuria anomochaeta]KAF2628872.1 S-adenosyl-L-methionine-dependent methyltransferase [Macroventuria anomochaeta]